MIKNDELNKNLVLNRQHFQKNMFYNNIII